MIERCDNKQNNNYSHYGERGIKVECIDWYDFKKFMKWALANGYTDELTIERIEVDGNYKPSNCTWITKKMQSRNRRVNRLDSEDIAKMHKMQDNGFKRKEIFEVFKNKCNNRTQVDAILRGERWS